MKTIWLSIFLSMLLMNIGCTSLSSIPLSPSEQQLLQDNAFKGYQHVEIETQEQIFELSDDAKAFVRSATSSSRLNLDQMRSLVDAIFGHSNLDLLYISNANTVAKETFKNRAANCLSMSIMAYAMAEYAGFSAQFQDVSIPAYWTRREGFSLLNGHINVDVFPPRDSGVVHLIGNTLEVDFDPQGTRSEFQRKALKRHQVVAMFYNNKGADALVNSNYIEAYAYLRSAVQKWPDYDSAWVNLGFLYRKNGLLAEAELAYLEALNIDRNNSSAIENLAYLYRLTNRHSEAQALLTRLERKLDSNPYYHFNLGERDFDNERYDQALQHYRTALQLDKTKHEIYFGLAKVHYVLGNVRRSQRYLIKAKRKSNNRQDQQLYQGKLNVISGGNS